MGQEVLVRVERLLALGRRYPDARTVGQYPKALLVVHQIGFHDLIEHVLVHGRIAQRHQRLDAAIEVALHQIGRGNVDVRLAARQSVAAAEGVDARVLEKAPDDRLDADVLGEAGHARPQAANAAHDQIDFDAGAARRVERVDDFRNRPARCTCPRSPPACRFRRTRSPRRCAAADVFFKRERRDRHQLEPVGLGVAGDEVEDPRDVARRSPDRR